MFDAVAAVTHKSCVFFVFTDIPIADAAEVTLLKKASDFSARILIRCFPSCM